MPERGLGLATLRREYADGSRTPVDVAETVLAGLSGGGTGAAAAGGPPVWISTVDAEDLRARAAELTARSRMAELPLYGIPFAVKDNIDVAGLATTAGCPDFAYRARRSAPVVTRLLEAGAMLVGKTNLDQFATGLTGTRSPYGACESVFGGGLIAGGSSSGSAVAVASGQVSFALGTDTAGSGRVPAALNGIVGLKPTRGLLSTLGVVPACRSLDCVSVFATDVLDAGAVLSAARGIVPNDPWCRPVPPDRGRVAMPATLRLGLPHIEDLEFFGDDGQRDRFVAAAERAAGLVAETVPVELGPLFEAGDLLYQGPWVAERLADLGGFLDGHPDSVLPVIRTVLEKGRGYSAVDAFRGLHRLRELHAWADRLWERVDVLLLPTIGTTYTLDEIAADPLGNNLRLGRYTQFANLLDLAAVAVPNGFAAPGRPAGVSLLGPAFSDPTLARLAAELYPEAEPDLITLAVVGRHLSGESRNDEMSVRIGPVKADPYPWPYDGAAPVERTALLCIDWQTDFCGPGGYVDSMGYDIGLTRAGLPATARLLAHAREIGMLVIHTREGHDPDLNDLPPNKRWRSARIGAEIGGAGPCGRILVRGEPGFQIVPEVAPVPGEVIVDKPGKGAFYATNLDLVLRTHGITHLILTGITTDVCVHTTMREANDRGYECLILADCTGATDPGNHTAALHMVTMQGGVFGCVATSEDVIAATAQPHRRSDTESA